MIIITSCARHVGNVCFSHLAKFKMAETDTVRESITVVRVTYSMSGSQGEERGGSKAIFSTMSRKVKQANKYGDQANGAKIFRDQGNMS